MKNIKGRFEQLDMLDEESVSRFTLEVMGALKKIDILVNNAGINYIESIDEICEENWERILKVNLTGAMNLIKETANVMKKNSHGGKILNISSIFGVVSKEKRNSYSASKTGLIGLTRSSALDLARHNILVNALCPGFTNTELTASVLSQEEMISMASDVPLRRFAEVSEIATIAVFLVSDLNSYMTGQTLIADGGFTAK
jgi:NAD(P)-dependent dehydrogenase (short-subunit alcohol dehydrogenase family)